MNIKSNKGLSMIAVVIVFAAIIATIIETVIIAKKWVQQEKVEDVTTTMLLIQARCKTYEDKETMEENADKKEEEQKDVELKGTLIKDIEDNETINLLIVNNIIKKEDKYYLLSSNDLEELHVYDVDSEAIYLVNYDSKEVIYANGIEKDGKTLYKLSDIKGDE